MEDVSTVTKGFKQRAQCVEVSKILDFEELRFSGQYEIGVPVTITLGIRKRFLRIRSA